MPLELAILSALALGIGADKPVHLVVTHDSIVGAWECGPTTMKGPQFEMTVVIVTKYAADGTFESTTSSVIAPSGQSAISQIDSARGSWKLDGTILSSSFKDSKFISSSDPSISQEFGQKIQDDQLRKKSVYKSEILEIGQTSMRMIPVESEYAEAVVESVCKRS